MSAYIKYRSPEERARRELALEVLRGMRDYQGYYRLARDRALLRAKGRIGPTACEYAVAENHASHAAAEVRLLIDEALK